MNSSGEKSVTSLLGTVDIHGRFEREFGSFARVTLEQAVQSALKVAPGRVIEALLEEQNGFLVYAVEIASSDLKRKEVLVDAGTGKALAVRERLVDVSKGNPQMSARQAP